MSVAIRKVEGVESVKVSLNEGAADVKLKPGNRVDPERIRQAVRDNGFTPKGAEVRVAGRVIERGGKPALEVTGPDLVYVLDEHPDASGRLAELEKAAIGREVVAIGHLPETLAQADPAAPRTLRIREFVLEGR